MVRYLRTLAFAVPFVLLVGCGEQPVSPDPLLSPENPSLNFAAIEREMLPDGR